MRAKFLCIANDGVYEIPLRQIDAGEIIKTELSNQTVLLMIFAYETENRKPYRLGPIWFERVTFDADGVYDMKNDHLSEENRVKLEYAMSGLVLGEPQPLPIPRAPIIPSEKEIQVIETYLNGKYPLLLKNSPDSIKESIWSSKKIHEKNIKKFRDSHRAD